MDDLKQRLARAGVKFEIGGFMPSDDPFESWFGRVNVCAHGETWPEFAGKPMHALCQVNVRNLPLRPKRLADIDLITVFIGPDDLPIDVPNGENWCLRAYKNMDTLVSLAQRDTKSHVKAFPMRPSVFHEDFPCWEDVPIDLPEDVSVRYYDLFENIPGFKLGGWPTLIQAEIFWAPWNKHPAAPEFVFQIDSTEKGNWMWGDSGVGYFGRGTTLGKEDEWALSWQCY
jgi:uncharacterized protein YwqG